MLYILALLIGVVAGLRAMTAPAAISIAVVDDPTIHELNHKYLDHDWPTDVLSFVLQEDERHLEGEIIISADTAEAAAAEFGWPAAAEQLLYVIHGTLHLVGYRDKTPSEIQAMRAAEAKYLRKFGLEPPQARSSAETSRERRPEPTRRGTSAP